MFAAQGGLCKLCGEAMLLEGTRGASAAVDHCHKTDNVRGLVHFDCNRGLGFFKDDPEKLRRAAAYIEAAMAAVRKELNGVT